MPDPLPCDYDDPIFRHGQEAHALDHSILLPEYRDVHPLIADRLAAAEATPVLDLGCGPTRLGALLDERGVPWVGIDAAVNRLRLGNGPRILGDARRLPFSSETFGAVAALYMLYHFQDPFLPVGEAHRVLRSGGLFAACAPARDDEPEVAALFGARPPETFDSDMAPDLLGRLFEIIRVDRWDMLLYRFPGRDALWAHLVARGIGTAAAHEAAARATYPLWVTKRGATIWGRKRR